MEVMVLRPKEGDCRVFSSYGAVTCPPIQEAREKGEQAACASED